MKVKNGVHGMMSEWDDEFMAKIRSSKYLQKLIGAMFDVFALW